MVLFLLAFAALVLFHDFIGRACAAVVESAFGAGGVLIANLAAGLRSTVTWLKTSPPGEPTLVVIAAVLAAGAVAVARADFRVLTQSFDMILPAESGASALVAFSMVTVTVVAK